MHLRLPNRLWAEGGVEPPQSKVLRSVQFWSARGLTPPFCQGPYDNFGSPDTPSLALHYVFLCMPLRLPNRLWAEGGVEPPQSIKVLRTAERVIVLSRFSMIDYACDNGCNDNSL